jgi:hypothetical protein
VTCSCPPSTACDPLSPTVVADCQHAGCTGVCGCTGGFCQ